MKNYIKYIIIILFTIFSYLYLNKIIELSNENNELIDYLNDIKKSHDVPCIEGYIDTNNIVLGVSGRTLNIERSFNNMKGIGFNYSLLEYDKIPCKYNKTDYNNKYILGVNLLSNNISIVLDIQNMNYYKQFKEIFNNNNIPYSIMIYKNEYDKDTYAEKNILIKGNYLKDYKNIKNIKNTYCVKTKDINILDTCSKQGINSIKPVITIDNNLLSNIKNSLNKGNIIFIKENNYILNELTPSIKYIKSRGLNIVPIDDLFF